MNSTKIMSWLAMASLTAAGLTGTVAAQGEERERRGGQRGGGQPRGIMGALDLNRDGKLDQNEIDMAVVSLRKLDKNKDGELTSDELFGGRPGSDRAGGDRPGSDRPAGGDGRRRPGLAQLDKDGDGKISKEEAPPRLKERFGDVDKDGDGFLDKAEQEALIEAMRRFQQGGQGRPQRDRGAGEGGADKPRRPDAEPDAGE